jgi:3-hydroxyacyl-CoA dehydrogenase, C-terminal domain
LVEEGATVEAVDKALYDFGMAMGPLAVGDLAGLDVGWRIRKECRHLEKPGIRQAIAGDRLCELGRFGQKTGAGWYKYDENRRAIPDPEVTELVRKWAAQAGIPQRQVSAEEIVDRCLYALVNEGAHSRRRLCAPGGRYATLLTSTDTVSRRTAEGRCGLPTAPVYGTCMNESQSSIADTAHSGSRRRCSNDSLTRARDSPIPKRGEPPPSTPAAMASLSARVGSSKSFYRCPEKT